jgi:ABC-type nitrate/sulfonate/bicarbonate transport system substrate-binding protein
VAWAAEQGYFQRAGLNVQVELTSTGTTAAMVGGRLDLVLGSPGNLFGTINDGKPVQFVFQNDTAPFVVVAADPKITSITQCKSVATGAPGTNALAATVLSQRLFKTKWTTIPLTDPSAFGPTIISGRADCGIGPNILYVSSVMQGKLHVIFNSADKSELPAGWPGGTMQVIGGLTSDISTKGPVIAKFLKVYLAAIKDFIATPSADEAATLIAGGNGWEGLSPAVLTSEINAQKPAMAPNNGYVTPAEWQAMLSFQANGGLSIVNPSDSKWSYANLVNMSYYDQGLGKPAGG